MSERPNSDWDPRDPTILDDQRLAYDEMRERCPVAYSAFLNWSLFQHNDITNPPHSAAPRSISQFPTAWIRLSTRAIEPH